jgi:hypothetical protein
LQDCPVAHLLSYQNHCLTPLFHCQMQVGLVMQAEVVVLLVVVVGWQQAHCVPRQMPGFVCPTKPPGPTGGLQEKFCVCVCAPQVPDWKTQQLPLH